jgi:hypothetical protein
LISFERKTEPLLPLPKFIGRMAASVGLLAAVISLALFIGILGYHRIAHLGWVDSILNASMILGGMGPVDTLQTSAAKLFASGYALFSGVVFISSVGILLAPVFHRVVHKFHLDDEER